MKGMLLSCSGKISKLPVSRVMKQLNGKITFKAFEYWEKFCLSGSVQVLPLDVTIPRDSYV